MAVAARLRSPAAIASSTLRIAERMRERRDLLITVRRAAWRAAFLADFVLAITSDTRDGDRESGLIGSWHDTVNGGGPEGARRQRPRAPRPWRAAQATRLARNAS